MTYAAATALDRAWARAGVGALVLIWTTCVVGALACTCLARSWAPTAGVTACPAGPSTTSLWAIRTSVSTPTDVVWPLEFCAGGGSRTRLVLV